MNAPQNALLGALVLSLLTLGCSKEQEAEAPHHGSNQCTTPLTEDDITMDLDEIHEMVDDYDELLSNCYNQALDTNPGLQGRIEVNMIVDESGTPTQVCSGNTSLPDSRVVGCVLGLFKRFRFADRDEPGAAVYPVTFSPD